MQCVVISNTIYGIKDGSIYSLDTTQKQQQWQPTTINNSPIESLTVSNENLILLTKDTNYPSLFNFNSKLNEASLLRVIPSNLTYVTNSGGLVQNTDATSLYGTFNPGFNGIIINGKLLPYATKFNSAIVYSYEHSYILLSTNNLCYLKNSTICNTNEPYLSSTIVGSNLYGYRKSNSDLIIDTFDLIKNNINSNQIYPLKSDGCLINYQNQSQFVMWSNNQAQLMYPIQDLTLHSDNGISPGLSIGLIIGLAIGIVGLIFLIFFYFKKKPIKNQVYKQEIPSASSTVYSLHDTTWSSRL